MNSTIKLRKNSAISHRKLDKYVDMNEQMKAHLDQFRGWCKFESYSNVFDSYFVKVGTKSSLVTFKKVKFIRIFFINVYYVANSWVKQTAQ